MIFENMLNHQRLAAQEVLNEELENIKRIEKTLHEKKGTVTEKKRKTAMAVSAIGIVLSILTAVLLWNHDFGSLGLAGRYVMLAAMGVTGGFFGLHIYKSVKSTDYFHELFESLTTVEEIYESLEQYRNHLEKRGDELEKAIAGKREFSVAAGGDFRIRLKAIEDRLSHMEQHQTKAADHAVTALYFTATYAVAAVEVFALQNLICNYFGGEAWMTTVYHIMAFVAVVVVPTALSYYLHKCRGMKIGLPCAIWILLDGLIGFAASMIVAAVIGLVIAILIAILQLIAIGLVIVAVVAYGMSQLTGRWRNRD